MKQIVFKAKKKKNGTCAGCYFENLDCSKTVFGYNCVNPNIIWKLQNSLKQTEEGRQLLKTSQTKETQKSDEQILLKHAVLKSVCPKCDGKGEYYKLIPNGRVLIDCDCKKQTCCQTVGS